MKRLLTIILSVFMLFSSCLVIGAEGAVAVSATQNDNGDLILTVTGDDASKVVGAIYNYSNKNSTIAFTVGDNWTGFVRNGSDGKNYISKTEDNKLVISNSVLKDGDFVNDTNKIELLVDGTVVASTSIVLSGVNDVPTPDAVSKLTVSNSFSINAIVGKNPDNVTVKVYDENNNTTEHNTYWATLNEQGNYVGMFGSYYETFKENKTYYLIYTYKYTENKVGEKANPKLIFRGLECQQIEVAKGASGVTDNGWALFTTGSTIEYAMPLESVIGYEWSYDIENVDYIKLAGAGITPIKNQAFVIQFFAKDGYSVPTKADDITVTVGGTKTDFVYETFNYNGQLGGYLCVNGNKVQGDVKITTKCVQNKVDAKVDGNAPATSVEGTQEELNNKVDLTEEEVSSGATVYLAVSDNVKDEDKSLVNKNLEGNTLGQILNITLVKKVDNKETKVKETTSGLNISVDLDDSLINKDSTIVRTYNVIRVHKTENGTEIKVIPATYDETTKKVTFTTDKFSTYAIVYKDAKKVDKKDESTSSNNTSSDSKVVTCEQAMNSKNWTWSESKKACVYRVSNTSSK